MSCLQCPVPPEIYLPNKKISQTLGKETILECTVAAFPHAVTLWMKDGKQITTAKLKYRLVKSNR